jgi:predicted ATPase
VKAQGVRQLGAGGQRLSEYRFRHILFQKYLYSQLDQVERVHLHQAVGTVLEALNGGEAIEIAAQLALHFQKAGTVPKAIEYLRQAGERAMRLSANAEAITHYSQALELLETLPDTPDRARQELMLQIGLGVPLSMIKGYAAPDVGHAYARARELCRRVGETHHLFPVLCQLARFYSVRAEYQTAHEIGEQLHSLGQRVGDPLLVMAAHETLGWNLLWLGELAQSHANLEQVITMYDPQQHHSLVFRYEEDFGVTCLSTISLTLWLLGYPDQALKRSREAIALAQELAHPFSLAVAWFVAAFFYALLREVPATQEMAQACINLSVERGFTHWEASARMFHGWALAEQGRVEAGLAQMRQGKADFRAIGSEVGHPHQLALLAGAYGRMGQAEEGLVLLAEALAAASRSRERYYEAEIQRLKGELLQQAEEGGLNASREAAEVCFLKAIEVARGQEARSLELRATMSLCRLWQQQDRAAEARQILEEIYGWFSEGFDTPNLKEAKALLEALT